ncbi:MAG: uracil-DNA glycosylase [Rhodospirillales bacterium]
MTSQELLQWYIDAGVDETISDHPVNRFRQEAGRSEGSTGKQQASVPSPTNEAPHPGFADASPAPSPPPPPAAKLSPTNGDLTAAVHLAKAAKTVEELQRALKSFDACGLKKTATNLVFSDGNEKAPVLFVGEGPGAEEDRQGLPFVGPSGKLLDKMLASIGLDRTGVLISNTVFWRPPGNRTPTPQETAICLPFVERLIELVDPKILVTLGGPAAKSLLAQTAGVGRLRGKWFEYETAGMTSPIDATALYHPAYLLRSPGQKRDTWRDLLAIKHKLAG